MGMFRTYLCRSWGNVKNVGSDKIHGFRTYLCRSWGLMGMVRRLSYLLLVTKARSLVGGRIIRSKSNVVC